VRLFAARDAIRHVTQGRRAATRGQWRRRWLRSGRNIKLHKQNLLLGCCQVLRFLERPHYEDCAAHPMISPSTENTRSRDEASGFGAPRCLTRGGSHPDYTAPPRSDLPAIKGGRPRDAIQPSGWRLTKVRPQSGCLSTSPRETDGGRFGPCPARRPEILTMTYALLPRQDQLRGNGCDVQSRPPTKRLRTTSTILSGHVESSSCGRNISCAA